MVINPNEQRSIPSKWKIVFVGVIVLLVIYKIWAAPAPTVTTLSEADLQKNVETYNQGVKTYCESTSTGTTAEREAQEAKCFSENKKADIIGKSTGGIAPVPPSRTTYVKTPVANEKNSGAPSSKGEADVSQGLIPTASAAPSDNDRHGTTGGSYSTPTSALSSPARESISDIRKPLGLEACRIVQKEEEHIRQDRGHVYATDIACEVGKSFTVSAPQWKKQYKVISVGYDKRLGNYIVLRHGIYMFVFGHTESPHHVGDMVEGGSQIGYSDKSGIAQNIHVHFELWRDGYNITSHEMLGQGSEWNNQWSFRLLTQRGWYNGIDDSIAFITSFEGFRDTSYEDPKGSGRWSIGYGTYADGPGEKISRSQAAQRIRSKVIENMDFIYRNRLATTWNQRIALSSFFYNLGTARPEIIQAIRTGNGLENTWKAYVNKGSIYEAGLTKRRNAEWKKFITK